MLLPLLGLCLFVLAVAIGAGVGVALKNKNNGNTRGVSSNPNATPANSTYQYLQDLLPPESWVAATTRTSSPQHKALEWAVQDPYLRNYSDERLYQRFALAALYYSTKGDHWNNDKDWLSYEINECKWEGQAKSFFAFGDIEVEMSPCRSDNSSLYERLWIEENNLEGSIPDEIYIMSSLKSISFWKNTNLSGTISPKIHKLQDLAKINLVRTSVTGSLPSQVGLLSQLKIFFGGPFTSTLPTEIAVINSLEQFTAGPSLLSGTIPTEYGLLTNLKLLGVKQGHLTGTLPTELGQLTK